MPEEARHFLDSIPADELVGIRDRALVAVMVCSFASLSAVIFMQVEEYYRERKRYWFRLREKGGKQHAVPAHHKAEEYMDTYLEAAGIAQQRGSPLFRSVDRHRQIAASRLHRQDVLRIIKRCARQAPLPAEVCCHTFRATGITAYLSGGGTLTLEKAQQIAAHASPRTTKLYDRTPDELTLDKIEKIQL
jgi:integrase